MKSICCEKDTINLHCYFIQTKNKHPKAETAFKLVSEAYACLSDKRKRAVYNVERSKLLCKKCQHMVQRTSSVSGEVQLGQSHPDLM